MTERQLFGVVLRGFGIWALFLGVSAINGFVQIYGIRGLQTYDWQLTGAFTSVYFLIAFALLGRADAITEFVYRSTKHGPPISN